MKDKQISKVMSEMAKLSHKKNPRGKKFFQKMAKVRWDKAKKLSTKK